MKFRPSVIVVHHNTVPFPDIRDWSSLKITLWRGGCMNCQAYKLEIDGDGSVTYDGFGAVAVLGRHRDRIPEAAVRDLFSGFRQADFFDAVQRTKEPDPDGAVFAMGNDIPTADIVVAFDGRSAEMTDAGSGHFRAPDEIRALEDRIDGIASSWIGGDAQTLAKLEAEGWDFRLSGDKHARMLATAADVDNTALVRQLLAAGVRAKNGYGCAALSSAALHGNPEMVRVLVAAGAPISAPEIYKPGSAYTLYEYYPRCTALVAAAEGGVPQIVDLILSLHPDLEAQDHDGVTPLMAAVHGDFESQEDKDRRLAALRRLIAAGVRVDARDERGQTALMLSYEPEVTQALLEGGADPTLKDAEGKTALDLADSWRDTAPVLKAWLAAHGEK